MLYMCVWIKSTNVLVRLFHSVSLIVYPLAVVVGKHPVWPLYSSGLNLIMTNGLLAKLSNIFIVLSSSHLVFRCLCSSHSTTIECVRHSISTSGRIGEHPPSIILSKIIFTSGSSCSNVCRMWCSLSIYFLFISASGFNTQ